MKRSIFHLTAALVLILALAVTAPEAAAQGDLRQPVATTTVLSLPGGGTVDGDTLHLPLGQQVELRIEALDQFGRRFPQERLRFEFKMDRNCRGLVELAGANDNGITLRTGKGAGSCDVLLWLPNTMNADRRLRIVANRGRSTTGSGVVTRPATGAIDTEEELVAASLFRAVLGRDPDAEWIAASAQEIRHDRTRDQIRSLLGSPEFSQRRQSRAAEDLLRDFYQGLLGREPDAAGVRRYLGDMRDGDFEEVIRDMLDSREFRERLAREIR